MTSKCELYVSTYAKFNSGNYYGEWLDLSNYSSKEEFITACKEIHSDESDPEFMFQQCCGLPWKLYSEDEVSDDLFEFSQLNDSDKNLWAAYLEITEGSFHDAQCAFLGTADSELDYCYGDVENTGLLDSIPEDLRRYFDYESYCRDMFFDLDFVEYNDTGYVFSLR